MSICTQRCLASVLAVQTLKALSAQSMRSFWLVQHAETIIRFSKMKRMQTRQAHDAYAAIAQPRRDVRCRYGWVRLQ